MIARCAVFARLVPQRGCGTWQPSLGSSASIWSLRLRLHLAVVVPDRLDVVSVRVVHEGRVVPWPVVAITRSPVVPAAGRERRCMERLHLLATACLECEVQGRERFLVADPEVGVLAIVEAGALAVLHVVGIAQRLEGRGIETLGAGIVADGQSGVRDHRDLLMCPAHPRRSYAPPAAAAGARSAPQERRTSLIPDAKALSRALRQSRRRSWLEP